jgi:hypothetical protein
MIGGKILFLKEPDSGAPLGKFLGIINPPAYNGAGFLDGGVMIYNQFSP